MKMTRLSDETLENGILICHEADRSEKYILLNFLLVGKHKSKKIYLCDFYNVIIGRFYKRLRYTAEVFFKIEVQI